MYLGYGTCQRDSKPRTLDPRNECDFVVGKSSRVESSKPGSGGLAGRCSRSAVRADRTITRTHSTATQLLFLRTFTSHFYLFFGELQRASIIL